MRFSTLALSLLPIGAAYAATFTVKVGGNKNLAYDPKELTGVQNGDTVQFEFQDLNHTVTQSTFANPCSNITDANGLVTGIDSGYQAVSGTDLPVWLITINNASAPLWMYCRQGKHCQNGMVFAINPTEEKSWDMFAALAAQSAAVNGSPDPNASNSAAPSGTSAAPSGSDAAAGSAPSSTGSSATTPSPGVTNTPNGNDTSGNATNGDDNGVGALRIQSSAALLSVAGLALGLLL